MDFFSWEAFQQESIIICHFLKDHCSSLQETTGRGVKWKKAIPIGQWERMVVCRTGISVRWKEFGGIWDLFIYYFIFLLELTRLTF